jgi:hypothetical protein
MQRDYKTGSSDSVTFFLGREVEKTPAYGKKTLFVVGVQQNDRIEQILNDPYTQINEPIKHIFFGANQSYNPRTYEDYKAWESMIQHFLQNDYLCSLDIPLNQVVSFHEGPLCGYNNFIPQISVPIPYIKLWNYNTMLKIDDRTFKSTNPGVWTHSLHELMDRSKFTDWDQYKNDEVV